MSVADLKYNALIEDVMISGVWDVGQDVRAKYADGTPAHSKNLFGYQVKFEEGELPLVTSAKVFTTTAIKEMLLFWVHQTVQKKDFDDWNCKIWDEWFKSDGTLGQSYAAQFQKGDRNQVAELLYNIKYNPTSKRLMTSFWDFENAPDKALQECAWATQWFVRDGKLDLILIQRSLDVGLGCKFNWFQYSALQHLIAHASGLRVGSFTHQIGVAHYYDRHESILLNQLSLPQFEQPILRINPNLTDFWSAKPSDFILSEYEHGPHLPMEVAI